MFKFSLNTLAFAVTVTLAAVATPSISVAATPPAPYNVFQYCPYNNPSVLQYGSCVYNVTTSGTLAIGSTSLPIDKPIILQGGIEWLADSPLYDAIGAPTLNAPPGNVPGGLLGISAPPCGDVFLCAAFWNIVNTVNGVTATMESVQTIQTNFANALYPPTDGSDPTVARLAVRVRLSNPFLGNSCYIGSAQNPIVIKLQTGTTNPPLPNHPISGAQGTYAEILTDEANGYSYSRVSGSTMVDNSFAVPAASGCGNIALGLPIITPVLDFLVSGAVNLKVGLPSASGKNTAIMNGDTLLAGAYVVLALSQ